MLKAVQAAGLKTLLVSGGFTFFTERLKSAWDWTTPTPMNWKSSTAN
jgi:phosphoserine phosphatase